MRKQVMYGAPPPPPSEELAELSGRSLQLLGEAIEQQRREIELVRQAGIPESVGALITAPLRGIPDFVPRVPVDDLVQHLLEAARALAGHAAREEVRWTARIKLLEGQLDAIRRIAEGRQP